MAISALFLSHYRHKYMYNAYTHVRVHVQYMCRLLLTQCAHVCTCARVHVCVTGHVADLCHCYQSHGVIARAHVKSFPCLSGGIALLCIA